MLDDYIENISQDEMDQAGTQNNIIQHASVQPLTNEYSNMNFSFKQPISKSIPLTMNEVPKSYEEDILEKSSSSIIEQNVNDIPFATSNIIENELMEQPSEQYITGKSEIYNSIPLNDNIAYSEIVPSQNNIYTTVQPTTNYNIISEFPQYTYDQTIYESTPLPTMNDITYTTYPETPSVVAYSTQPSNIYTNFNQDMQKHAEVVPIDDNLMKNPQVAKNVRESQMHVNNYLKKYKYAINNGLIDYESNKIKWIEYSDAYEVSESNNEMFLVCKVGYMEVEFMDLDNDSLTKEIIIAELDVIDYFKGIMTDKSYFVVADYKINDISITPYELITIVYQFNSFYLEDIDGTKYINSFEKELNKEFATADYFINEYYYYDLNDVLELMKN